MLNDSLHRLLARNNHNCESDTAEQVRLLAHKITSIRDGLSQIHQAGLGARPRPRSARPILTAR